MPVLDFETIQKQIEEKGLDKIAEATVNFLQSGVPLYKLRGMQPKDMEYVYSIGYNYYLNGKYKDAAQMFLFCTINDHFNRTYWVALAGARQMNNQYPEAAECYFMANVLDCKEPIAYFQLAKCLLKLGDKANAETCLNKAIEYFADDPQYEAALASAETLMSALQQPKE